MKLTPPSGLFKCSAKEICVADSALNDRGCVYGVLIEDRGALILQRNLEQHHHKGLFELPGGKCEDSEDYITALLREFHQETGLDVSVLSPLRSYTFQLDRRTVRKEVYLVRRESGIVTLDGDHMDYKWVVPREFSRYHFVPNMKDDIRAGFRARLLAPALITA